MTKGRCLKVLGNKAEYLAAKIKDRKSRDQTSSYEKEEYAALLWAIEFIKGRSCASCGGVVIKGVRIESVNLIPENLALVDFTGKISRRLEKVRPLIGKLICRTCAYTIEARCRGCVDFEEVKESEIPA